MSYPTHFPLSRVERGLLAVGASLVALRAPWRADMVATVGETTGAPAVAGILVRLRSSAEGRALLRERPRVTGATLELARRAPEGSFGEAYGRFMGDRAFSPDDRPPVRFEPDPEAAYAIARLREVHDFWHVLFACGTDVFGETALKAVEFANTGLPMAGLAVVGGQTRLTPADRALLRAEFLPWGFRAGAVAADLVSVFYERRFDEDLGALRRRLRVAVAPASPRNTFETPKKPKA